MLPETQSHRFMMQGQHVRINLLSFIVFWQMHRMLPSKQCQMRIGQDHFDLHAI